MNKDLDYSALKKAIASLERGVLRSKNEPNDEEVRDAVIQRFEFTYELCWKMLKRKLEMDAANAAEIDAMSFKQLIREGAERQLIDDPEAWFIFREQRNKTSHAYDVYKAASVYKTAVIFLPVAQQLLTKLDTAAND